MSNWYQNSITVSGESKIIQLVRTEIVNQLRLDKRVDLHSIHVDDHFPYHEQSVLAAAFDTPWSPPIDLMQNIVDRFNVEIEMRYLDNEMGVIGVLRASKSQWANEHHNYSSVDELESYIDHFDGHDVAENEVLNLRKMAI